MNENNAHRRFLKAKPEYRIGSYIPDAIRLFKDSRMEDMTWLKGSDFGSVLYFSSKDCSACNIEVAFTTYLEHSQFNYAIFCENYDNESLKEIRGRFEKVRVYEYDLNCIGEELDVNVVPFMLVTNKLGQVITAGVVNEYQHALELLGPLLRVMQRGI